MNQTDRIIRPPWTPEQVAALNVFQQHGGMHPFTCGGEHTPGSPVLVAREDGWRCSDPYREGCDWTQDWAHAVMVERGREIAVSPAAPAGPPARADAALRDRIAEALRPGSRDRSGCYPEGLMRDVDAVLAVFPEPPGRAAVLLWAADQIDAGWFTTAATATAELRRLAAAAQQQEPTPCGPVPNQCDAEAGEPCANHERQQAHAEGEHCFCGPECGAEAQQQECTDVGTEFIRQIDQPDEAALAAVEEDLTGAQQQPDTEAPLSALQAREKTIRDHTLALHQIGEQLSQIESWFWEHLADARQAARQELGGPLPDDVMQQPAAADRIVAHRLAGGRSLHCLSCAPPPAGDIWEPVTAEGLEDGGVCTVCGVDVLIPQPAAADSEETRHERACTCSHPADEHSVYGCVDGCGCEWMPRRTANRPASPPV